MNEYQQGFDDGWNGWHQGKSHIIREMHQRTDSYAAGWRDGYYAAQARSQNRIK
jgi:hypothetical protein